MKSLIVKKIFEKKYNISMPTFAEVTFDMDTTIRDIDDIDNINEFLLKYYNEKLSEFIRHFGLPGKLEMKYVGSKIEYIFNKDEIEKIFRISKSNMSKDVFDKMDESYKDYPNFHFERAVAYLITNLTYNFNISNNHINKMIKDKWSKT